MTWLPWLSEYGLEQTRAFRALKVWMALAYHGRAGYVEAVGRDIDNAQRLAELVEAHPDLELLAHNLSIVCLRSRPPGVADDALDAHNERVLRDVQLGGRVFLSSTTLDDRFVLRACFVNPRTRSEDVDVLVEAIASAAGEAPAAPPVS
jgi:glutamate/tyrosine decarboxylase-like PLP-dependent enzyme